MLKLIGTDGSHYYAWNLEPGKYLIGRKPECDLVITDKTVSRKHAELEVLSASGECFLLDLESHNGTMVNGQRVTSRTHLGPNDHVMFGHAEFQLAYTDEPPSSGHTRVPTRELFATTDPEKSVILSIHEALQPLPSEVRNQPEVMATLFEMAKMLVLPEPREVMLERSLGLVAKAIPADRFAVLLTTETGKDIYVAASHLTKGDDPGSFTLSRTIVNQILTEKNAVLISDPRQDPRFAAQQSIIMSELKSAMAVPLFVEGRVLGILYADTADPRHRYDDDYLRLFATFGNLLAFRLLNYSLLSERHEREVIDSEIRRASLIQRKLLTPSLPEIPGYKVHAFQEQCRSVGGDLYDLALLRDGRLLFMVADVSGKGMGAALLMSHILASFRVLYDSSSFDLCTAVRQVSLQLFKHSAPEDFATLFLGMLDPHQDAVTFCNAGHNPAMLVRSGGNIEELGASGTMIGAFDGGEWVESTVKLSTGDLLFVFTDGVTEAEREGRQYSDERTKDVVTRCRHHSPEEIVHAIFEDINSFVKDEPRSDDITMLLIKKEAAC